MNNEITAEGASIMESENKINLGDIYKKITTSCSNPNGSGGSIATTRRLNKREQKHLRSLGYFVTDYTEKAIKDCGIYHKISWEIREYK